MDKNNHIEKTCRYSGHSLTLTQHQNSTQYPRTTVWEVFQLKCKNQNGNILYKEEDKSRDGRNTSVQSQEEDIQKSQQIKLEQTIELYKDWSEIKEEKIRKSTRKLTNNKATGPDNIKTKVVKEIKNISVSLLHTLLNKIWEEDKVPE